MTFYTKHFPYHQPTSGVGCRSGPRHQSHFWLQVSLRSVTKDFILSPAKSLLAASLVEIRDHGIYSLASEITFGCRSR
jgi:hypothetical protein